MLSTKNFNWSYQEPFPCDPMDRWTDIDMKRLGDNVKRFNQSLDSIDALCAKIMTSKLTLQQGILTGLLDGANTTFIVAPMPNYGLVVFKNGLLQQSGSVNDYIYNSSIITFALDNIPQPTDAIVVYIY